MDAALYTIPEIARDIDRLDVTEADAIYARNNIMDQIYEQEGEREKPSYSAQEWLNELTVASLVAGDMNEFDKEYGLTSVNVSPQYERVTSKMTKHHQPAMSEVQIMSEITDTVTNEAYRDSIFNLITTLCVNQPEMSIFDVRIAIEKGSTPIKIRVTLDVPYDTVINKETKDKVAQNPKWTVSWFQIRQDVARSLYITLTLTPVIIDGPITKNVVILPDVVTRPPPPLLMSTREVYGMIDGGVLRPLNEDITYMIDSLISGESSPSITSFRIKRDPTRSGVYNIEMGLHQTECTHGGGITMTTMNNIIEVFRDTWDLVFRVMFDYGRTLRITATYLNATTCLSKEDVYDYVEMNAIVSMDRFPIKKMIQFITNDTKMGIHGLEIKRVDDKRFSVSMDVEKCRPVSLDDDFEIIKLFNDSWALTFEHNLMSNGPIRRIIANVTRRSYIIIK